MHRLSAAGPNTNSGHVLQRGGPDNVRLGTSGIVHFDNNRPPSTWQSYTEEARIQFRIIGVERLQVTHVDFRDELVQATDSAPAWTWKPIPNLAAFVQVKTGFAEFLNLANNYLNWQPPYALQIGTYHFCLASVHVVLPLRSRALVSVTIHGPVVRPTTQQTRRAS